MLSRLAVRKRNADANFRIGCRCIVCADCPAEHQKWHVEGSDVTVGRWEETTFP